MAERASAQAERARSASREELPALLHDPSPEVLAAVLENPLLDESGITILLERKDLPAVLVEKIAYRKEWMRSYRVKRGVASHPHTPRLLAISLLRELYLFDLVSVSLLPSAPAEIRQLAEELILARLLQLPLGEKFTLARRGSARVAGALLAQGHEQVVPIALDNNFLTESQVLRVLARENVPTHVVAAIARHRKWSYLYNVRIALVRHALTPLARVLAFLPDLAVRDLRELAGLSELARSLRQYIRQEIQRRSRAGSARTRQAR